MKGFKISWLLKGFRNFSCPLKGSQNYLNVERFSIFLTIERFAKNLKDFWIFWLLKSFQKNWKVFRNFWVFNLQFLTPTDITWKIKGGEFQASDRIRQLPEGSLYIKEVIRQDAGEYTCHAENSIAKDSITHKLVILAPPQAPQVIVGATTTDSITLKLKKHEIDNAPLHGFTLHYKPEFGEWETGAMNF